MKHEIKFLKKRYKREGKHFVIELELDEAKFLFDRKDPSPIRGRDLNEDTVTYIINSLEEIPKRYPTILRIHLKRGEMSRIFSKKIEIAIRNYFQFEAFNKTMELHATFKRGFISLIIGLSFLFFCTYLSSIIVNTRDLFGRFASEGVTVLGWVSMWNPIQIFLYEWWQIRANKMMFLRASFMNIEICYRDNDYE